MRSTIKSEKEQGKMNTVIERLRSSKAKADAQERVAGHSAGRKWAMEDADYGELVRVVEWSRENGDAWDGVEWNAPFGAAGWLYAAIEDDGRPLNDDVEAFWESVAQSDSPTDEFVRGFVEGVVEVWDEVSDKL
jgi:hypothetical protein